MREEDYNKGFRDALLAVKEAKVGILGTPSSQDTKTIIGIVVDTIARSRKISLESTPLIS